MIETGLLILLGVAFSSFSRVDPVTASTAPWTLTDAECAAVIVGGSLVVAWMCS